MIAQFFQDLFPSTLQGQPSPGRFILTRTIRQQRNKPESAIYRIDHQDRLLRTIDRQRGQIGPDYYFGVLPRNTGKLNQTGKSDISHGRTLWVDIDFKQVVESDHVGDIINTLERRCQEFNIPKPNYTTHTGGGLHWYWFLPNFIPAMDIEAANLTLIQALEYGDPACFDASRLLRIPTLISGKRLTDVVLAYQHSETVPPGTLQELVTYGSVIAKSVTSKTISPQHGSMGSSSSSGTGYEIQEYQSCSLVEVDRLTVNQILYGLTTNEEQYQNDRDRLCLGVASRLKQYNFDASNIAWVLTNPDFQISSKYYDLKTSRGLGVAERFVQRILERIYEVT